MQKDEVKASVLIQTALDKIPLENSQLQREQSIILEQAVRVVRASEDHHVDTNSGRGALSSLLMHRSIKQGW